MSGKPNRLDHPKIVYVIGAFFMIITLTTSVGILYHLTFSHHGPALLVPVKEKIEEKNRSLIMEEVKLLEEQEKHRHFHNIAEFPEMPEDMRPVCFICHSDYPHSKSKKVRALLNMHTQFFTCEACHIEDRAGKATVYAWYNPMEESPKGPFFGTSYNSETGNLEAVDDKFSKISAFFEKGGNLESTMQKQDAPLALDYVKVRDQLTPNERDNVKKKFHVNIKPKGHECKKCHDRNSILNFSKLGFSDNRIVDLEQLNITGMITKYEKFYLPNLFKDE